MPGCKKNKLEETVMMLLVLGYADVEMCLSLENLTTIELWHQPFKRISRSIIYSQNRTHRDLGPSMLANKPLAHPVKLQDSREHDEYILTTKPALLTHPPRLHIAT